MSDIVTDHSHVSLFLLDWMRATRTRSSTTSSTPWTSTRYVYMLHYYYYFYFFCDACCVEMWDGMLFATRVLRSFSNFMMYLNIPNVNWFLHLLLFSLQVVIFVSKVKRAVELSRLLEDCNFPSICIHSQLKQEERIARFKAFKDFSKRILVSTDLFGRGNVCFLWDVFLCGILHCVVLR